MLTVRIIKRDYERLLEAKSVWSSYNDKGKQVADLFFKDEGCGISSERLESGHLYVMNEAGATVWDLRLG